MSSMFFLDCSSKNYTTQTLHFSLDKEVTAQIYICLQPLRVQALQETHRYGLSLTPHMKCLENHFINELMDT